MRLPQTPKFYTTPVDTQVLHASRRHPCSTRLLQTPKFYTTAVDTQVLHDSRRHPSSTLLQTPKFYTTTVDTQVLHDSRRHPSFTQNKTCFISYSHYWKAFFFFLALNAFYYQLPYTRIFCREKKQCIVIIRGKEIFEYGLKNN